jgi:hypothetical protein
MAGRGTTLIARGTLFQTSISLPALSVGSEFTALCGRKKKSRAAHLNVYQLGGYTQVAALSALFVLFIWPRMKNVKACVRLQVFHEVLLPVLRLQQQCVLCVSHSPAKCCPSRCRSRRLGLDDSSRARSRPSAAARAARCPCASSRHPATRFASRTLSDPLATNTRP